MFKRLMGDVFMVTGAVMLAFGVIGVFVAVERYLANQDNGNTAPKPKAPEPEAKPQPAEQQQPVEAAIPVPVAATPAKRAPRPRNDRQFSIKRTKSEVGYVYWILEGYGKYKCFILCDSWEEAMEQAKTRLGGESEETQEFAFTEGL